MKTLNHKFPNRTLNSINLMMKKELLYVMMGASFLTGLASCSEDDAYDNKVIRDIELYADGSPWQLSVGISTRPIFVYATDGDWVANYSSLHRFTLKEGAYKIVCSPNPESCIDNTGQNLYDLYIPQDSSATRSAMEQIQISAPVDYSTASDAPLKADMLTRTGVLRIRALDEERDMSYTTVRAIMTTPRSAYRIADESYVDEPMTVIREKDTPTGGMNYTDDFGLFPTASDDRGVSIRFEFLNAAREVVKTKQITGTYGVYRDSVQILQVYLNNPDDNKAYPLLPATEQ